MGPSSLIRIVVLACAALLGSGAGRASAQETPAAAPPAVSADPAPAVLANPVAAASPPPAVSAIPKALLSLSAVFAGDNQPVRSGLHWRVFKERPEEDGSHALVAESGDLAPTFSLPDGDYVVHAAFGLASATKRVALSARPSIVKLVLNAGALRIGGVIGDRPIPPDRLSVSVFVPAPGNSEAKRIVDDAAPGEILLLPEGTYHVVSTYLDTVGVGSLEHSGTNNNASNSVVTADIRVQPGILTDTTLRHRAAVLTLKLVNAPNGEALTETSFTVLTPGGDVIRELIGAFPSLVLSEGEYVAIARHAGVTYQADFKVQSGLDRDVEIVAQ